MRFTVSLKENRQFKRLYAAGKSVVDPNLAVYCRKNRLPQNRLGITVGGKLGKAVIRNRVRRRLREAYRLFEASVRPGYDIVVVARARAAESDYRVLDASLRGAFARLGLVQRGDTPRGNGELSPADGQAAPRDKNTPPKTPAPEGAKPPAGTPAAALRAPAGAALPARAAPDADK